MNFNLSQLFSAEYLPYSLPALILLATGLIVVLLLVGRKANAGLKPPKTSSKGSGVIPDHGASASDRRESIRRDGPPVEVVFTSPALNTGANQGYVIDRSTGGLRLAVAAGMAAGSSLQIKAKHAPDNIPWVTVIVRNCKNTGEHFELGCEFEKTPPWNVLLLFG